MAFTGMTAYLLR